jgi:polyhydroxyalkanoate synthase
LELLRSETAGEPARMEQALCGLRAYQEAERSPPMRAMSVIAERHGAMLRDYGGEGPDLVVIPSLINPPNVLDLTERQSLLRWLAGRGHRVLLVDWGSDVRQRSTLSVGGHVEEVILPFVAGLPSPPSLAGYCLGGTMAIAAASLAPVRSLLTIAAPWRFGGFPEEARALLAGLWLGAQPSVALLDLLPMEVLQAAFWSLDPARTVGKFERFAAMAPGSDDARAFVTLEDWANDGPPLPAAAAREMFESLFAEDETGNGSWQVGGKTISPDAITAPQLHIVSTTDRIVPEDSAVTSGERLLLSQGHVGMIVGSRAQAALWEPLHVWLSRLSPQ